MVNGLQLFERRQNAVSQGVGVFVPTTTKSARGARITDLDGNSLIDFGGGIGVVNAGHCPPPVVKAIQEQAEKLLHTCFHISTYEPYVALCERLINLFPHGGQAKAMLTNTGAESVENAIKIARQATKRPAIICYSDAFHGRSMMGMTLTSKINYKLNCGPFAPEVYRLDFPNVYRRAGTRSESQFAADELRNLEHFCHTHVDPESVAAIIIELVQGEGGFNVAPIPYVQGLRHFCDRHGILLIVDEVQSGFCRTGKWGAYQHYGIEPDLTTWAKSMGSGMPIGAVVGKRAIMDAATPGTIGGTYLGNPVCCAAALATIDYMQDQQLNQRAVALGQTVMDRFRSMAEWAQPIGDVRGLGAMVAMELVRDRKTKTPHPDLCERLCALCLERGLILLKAGGDKNIIRVLSPLTISETDLKEGLDIIESSMRLVLEEAHV
ncbi:MAG: aspartate aminotransferase family protein [Acidobacteria bacterium]|nr:aspartate aminotransferase family protein [Acidobacteriota bacterium]